MDSLNYFFYEFVADLLSDNDLKNLSTVCQSSQSWTYLFEERRQCNYFRVSVDCKYENGQHLIGLCFVGYEDRTPTPWAQIAATNRRFVRFRTICGNPLNYEATFESEAQALPKLRFIASRLEPSGTFHCSTQSTPTMCPLTLIADPFRTIGMRCLIFSYVDNECLRFLGRQLDYGQVEELHLHRGPTEAQDLYRQAIQSKRMKRLCLSDLQRVDLDLFELLLHRLIADKHFDGEINSIDAGFSVEDFRSIFRDFEHVMDRSICDSWLLSDCLRHRATGRIVGRYYKVLTDGRIDATLYVECLGFFS